MGGFGGVDGDGTVFTAPGLGSPVFNLAVCDRHRGEGIADGVGEGGVSDKDEWWDIVHDAETFLLGVRRESCGTPAYLMASGCRM